MERLISGPEKSLEEDLQMETLKWLEKAEVLFCQVSGDEHFLENVSAYIHDSRYFLEKRTSSGPSKP